MESPQCSEFTCRWETHGWEHRHKSPQVTWHWGIRIQQFPLFVEGGTSQIYHVHLFSFVFICLLLWLIQGSQAWWFARPQMAHVSGSRWKLGLEYCSDITSMLLCTLRYEMFFHAQAKSVYVFSSNNQKSGWKEKSTFFLCNLEGGIGRRIWSMDPS